MRQAKVWGGLLALLVSGQAGATGATEDVLGRSVPVGGGRATLEFYGNRGTHDLLRAHAFDFAFSLRDEHPIVVVHVDLSDVPRVFRPLARMQVRESYERSLDHLARLFRAEGEEPPGDLATHVYFVVDAEGEPHRAVGLSSGFATPLARVVGPRGNELLSAPFPESAPSIARVLARAR